MPTVEIRFKEDGREISLDWLTDQFAAKVARMLKEQMAVRKNEILSTADELGSHSAGSRAGHGESERPAPKAVSINEAARLLGIRPPTLRVRVKRGQIRVVRIGRRVLVPMESIERALHEGIPGRR